MVQELAQQAEHAATAHGRFDAGKTIIEHVSNAKDHPILQLPAIMGIECWFGTTADCVNAALTGRWSGGLE